MYGTRAGIAIASVSVCGFLLGCPGNAIFKRDTGRPEGGVLDGGVLDGLRSELAIFEGGSGWEGITVDSTVTNMDANCSANPETLDGKDNNCDGDIDEGFWAVISNETYTALAAQHPGCTLANGFSAACAAAAHRTCKASGYVGGYGPVEFGTSTALIVCLADAKLYTSIPIATLTAEHASCTASNTFSVYCSSAIHRYCKSSGYKSGVGPVEVSSSSAVDFLCVNHATIYSPSWSDLTAQHAYCTLSDYFSAACSAATNRYCTSKKHTTGFGPVEMNTSLANVVCLDRQ